MGVMCQGARRSSGSRRPVTIAVPTSGGWTFEAQLEEDEFHMLWLVQRYKRRGKRQLSLLLSAALKTGCRIVSASPEEQAMLEAHGLGSGRVQ